MKLEVDTSLITIEKVVKAVLELGTIADISIEDPPLEEIIAHIYSKPHSKNGNSQ
jgi:ABC-2 type transport system ATP-binding protein